MAEEAKFTPGPWSIGWRRANLGGEERPVTAIGGSVGEWIALLPHGWFDGFGVVEDGELKANARLIAAAPDLYALLAEANELYSSRGLLANDMTCGNWINNVRAALSRVSPNGEST